LPNDAQRATIASMILRVRTSLVCLLLTLALAPGSVLADGDWKSAPYGEQNEAARAEFDRGVQHYNDERYGEAEAAFSRAFDLSQQPAYLFSLSRVQQRRAVAAGAVEERIAHYRDAIKNLGRYVRMAGGTRISEAYTLIESMEKKIKQIQDLAADEFAIGVTLEPENARLFLDGAAQVDRSAVKVKRGEHKFLVVADGYDPQEITRDCKTKIDFLQVKLKPVPIHLTVRGRPGAEVWIGAHYMGPISSKGFARVPVEPGMANVFVRMRGATPFQTAVYVERGKEEPRPVDAPLSASGTRIGTVAVWGAAGASIVFGAVATGVALSAENDFMAVKNTKAAGMTVFQDEATRADERGLGDRVAWRNAAIAGFGIGVGFAALGAALYALDMPDVPLRPFVTERSVAKRSTRIVPTGSGLMLHGEF
jgi:hypothetical protein